MNERGYMAGEEVAIDLKGLMLAVWRAKRWIIPATVLLGLATAFLLSQMTPRYKGEAKILIESREAVLGGDKQAGAEGDRTLLDQEGIASQVQLLKSRDLARSVARKLKLSDLAEFNPAGKGGGSLIGDLGILFGLSKDPLRISPEERVLEAYFRAVNIYPIEKTRVIAVEFSSRDRQLAARAANEIVASYFELQSNVKRSQTEDEAAILEPEIAKLQAEVKAAEEEAEKYRAGAGLFVGTNNTTLVQQQMAELSTQLSNADAQKAEAQAKASLVRSLLQRGAVNGSSEVLNSQLIQRLRERQVTLRAQLAEVSTTLLDNHPRIKALRSQLADLDGQIRQEVRKILAGLESDVSVATKRIDAIRARLNEVKAESAGASESSVRLRELQRDAEIKSKRLALLLDRYRQAEAGRTAENLPVDARAISRATTPLAPYFPKVMPITIAVTLGGFLIMIALVLVREFLSGHALHVVASAPVEPAPPAAGAVPMEAQVRWNDSNNLHRMMPPEPAVAAEHVRLETAREIWRRIRREGKAAKRIVVASAVAGECGRRAAFALVRSAASDAACRAVMIDTFGPSDGNHADDVAALPGITDLIAGSVSFAQVIFRDRQSRAHIVPRGTGAVTDEDLAGERFHTVLDALDYTYDHLILDAGPLTFGRGVARLLVDADHVVLATTGSVTDTQTSIAYDMLLRNGVEAVSVVSIAEPPVPTGTDDGSLGAVA
ncbi:MAG: succinoglycan transporter [Hyphomicrobiales bacterium]|nr:MAG: succinoglycan transporter [Hyphomicrobiales bacterium]